MPNGKGRRPYRPRWEPPAPTGPFDPPQPGWAPPPSELRQPGGRPLPWSYYQRVANKIDVPENFWDWLGQGYPIRPSWQSMAEEAPPMVDLETTAGGYYGGGQIVSRYPFSGRGWVYKHELGHHMDLAMTGQDGLISQRPEWQQGVRRWRYDPQYPMGRNVWDFITGVHPVGSKKRPAWGEAYAHAAGFGFRQVPPYMRGFYPWRDWQELEDIERRRRMQLIATHNLARGAAEDVSPDVERERVYRNEVVAQSALDAGITSADFDRMWQGNYQEHPIPAIIFSFRHGRFEGVPAEEVRAEWDKIEPRDRHKALKWFFEGVWPIVKDDPEEHWYRVKEFLSYIGIEEWGIVDPERARTMVDQRRVLRMRQAARGRRGR